MQRTQRTQRHRVYPCVLAVASPASAASKGTQVPCVACVACVALDGNYALASLRPPISLNTVYLLQAFSAVTGEFRFRFGRKGHLPGQLMRPTGIAVTSSGNYLVADYENCSLNVFRCVINDSYAPSFLCSSCGKRRTPSCTQGGGLEGYEDPQ